MPRTLTPAGEDNIVTMLLHRGSPERAWYDGAVLYQSASRHPAEDEVSGFEPMVPHAARLGADGVLLAGIVPDSRRPVAREGFQALLARAERLGQKVVASLDVPISDAEQVAQRLAEFNLPLGPGGPASAENDGAGGAGDAGGTGIASEATPMPSGARRIPSGAGLASPDEEAMLARARDLCTLGCAGVGVGYLLPGSPKTAAVARMTRTLREEFGEQTAVTVRADAVAHNAVLEEFDEAALPLLRHDGLWVSGWHAHAARNAITAAVRWCDAKHAPLVWTIFAAAPPADPEVTRLYSEPLTPAGKRRLSAVILAMLALPGTVVLRQGEEVGLLDLHPRTSPAEVTARIAEETETQRGVPGSPYETYRTALRLRRDLNLGTGPLSWVQIPGLPQSSTVCYLNRNLLVISNLGEEDVVVPQPGTVVHSSSPVHTDAEERVEVPAQATVWLTLD